MRMLVLPAALALAFLLYLPLPRAFDLLLAGVRRMHAFFLRLYKNQGKKLCARCALACCVFIPAALLALLGLIHPAVCALTMAPLFGALALVPRAAGVKRELDSGSLSKDIAAYEALVRTTCGDFAPAFVTDACLPLLLCAIGLPLRIGGALGWMALVLRTLAPGSTPAKRILAPLERAAQAILRALMLLSSCLVGRSPFRTRGETLSARLLSILAIDPGDPASHAPVSGDITQAAFLCCFCASLLCALLTLALLPLG